MTTKKMISGKFLMNYRLMKQVLFPPVIKLILSYLQHLLPKVWTPRANSSGCVSPIFLPKSTLDREQALLARFPHAAAAVSTNGSQNIFSALKFGIKHSQQLGIMKSDHIMLPDLVKLLANATSKLSVEIAEDVNQYALDDPMLPKIAKKTCN
jgi:hypothetical protein